MFTWSLFQCPLTWQNKWEGPEEPMQYLRAVVTRALALQVLWDPSAIDGTLKQAMDKLPLKRFTTLETQASSSFVIKIIHNYKCV